MSIFSKSAAIGLVLSAIVATPSLAAPIYSASIDASLSLSSATISDGSGGLDVEIVGESLLLDSGAFSDGVSNSDYTASLSPSDPTSLFDEPIVVQLSASGAAPGIGAAESFALGDSLVTIFNNSLTNTVQLDFVLRYDLAAIAEIDDPLFQFGTASTFFSLQSSQDFDPIAEFELLADTDTMDTDLTVSDMLNFSLFVGPESEASLFLLSDVSGFILSDLEAATPVPLPSMAALFGLSALALGLKKRRKR